MAKRKHSGAEILAKLAQADDLAAHGKIQTEIARELGISVMTLHRWRKGKTRLHRASESPETTIQFEQELGLNQRIADLQLENSRLRRLLTDLLLEKMKLEEIVEDAKPSHQLTKLASP